MLKNGILRFIFLLFICGIIIQVFSQDIEKRNIRVMNTNTDNVGVSFPDTVYLENNGLRFSYNDDTAVLSFKDNNRDFIVGIFKNTFNIPPEIETKQTDSLIYIIAKSKFYYFGTVSDVVYVLIYDKNNGTINKLIETEEVGEHNVESDLLNVEYYDAYIDIQGQQLIINEYIPYKSLNSEQTKYKTTITKYPLQIPR